MTVLISCSSHNRGIIFSWKPFFSRSAVIKPISADASVLKNFWISDSCLKFLDSLLFLSISSILSKFLLSRASLNSEFLMSYSSTICCCSYSISVFCIVAILSESAGSRVSTYFNLYYFSMTESKFCIFSNSSLNFLAITSSSCLEA